MYCYNLKYLTLGPKACPGVVEKKLNLSLVETWQRVCNFIAVAMA